MEEFNIPHAEYIQTLSQSDAKIALQFISDNPDCPLDTIKQAVRIQHA
jgi:hypothetical protein